MNLSQRFEKFFHQKPQTDEAAFVAPNATVVGDVRLGKDSSIWYGAVLRGDINSITIGEGTNLQDGVIVHLADELGTQVGDHVTVGHGAILHACTVGNECLIGMRATVLDGAIIGDQCIVGAHALVPKNFEAPTGSLILGTPAKVVRQLTAEERAGLKPWAEKYVQVARAHAAE